MTQSNQTIFALSSAPGRGGVAVVRASGPAALEGLKKLAFNRAFPERNAVFCGFYDEGRKIDQGLALYFKGPASFTGEDVVEYHIHGGRAVTDALLKALGKLAGHRPAEPGEFTKRAFENGKLDLTAAEAVADLINAETQSQREQALFQMDGALEGLYSGWAGRLKKALAHQEAEIEFPEDDMPSGIAESLKPELEKIHAEIKEHLDDKRRGERLREGISIAIVGAPNAGKSSLLNALARREAAIVSEQAGTTRDVIEVHLDLGGFPVIVADTAGLREKTDDAIEVEGMRRARKRAEEADFRLAVFDATKEPDRETLEFLKDGENTLVVLNKTDLVLDPSRVLAEAGTHGIPKEWAPASAGAPACSVIAVSAKTGKGMIELLDALTKKIADLYGSEQRKTPRLTRPRHRLLAQECRAHVERALKATLPELAAEDLRLATRALGKLTGRVDVEDLLDVIFRDFCIGK